MKILQGKNKLNLEKASPKQTKPKVATLMSLNEFLKIHSILPEIVMSDLIRAKLKQIVNLQDIIKPDEVHCKSKRGKIYNLTNIFLPSFLSNMDEIYLLLKNVDEKQSNFSAKIKSLDKGRKIVQTEILKMTQDYFKV